MEYQEVAPNSLDKVFAHIAAGGRVIIPTYSHCTVIDSKVVARFDKAGAWLLKSEGNGYRVRAGKGSFYVLPGQLKYA